MPRHLLTAKKVSDSKPRAKPYRKADGDGLYLYVPPSAAAAWQFRYRLHGKQQTATLGKLANMTLLEARVAAESARRKAASGAQLTVAKRVERAKQKVATANTFAAVATDWIKTEARRAKWSPSYQGEVEASVRNHLRDLDALPLHEIVPSVIAPVLRKVETNAPYMLEKVRPRLRAIFDYAVELGIIVGNPVLTGRRGPKLPRKHYPAITDLSGIGAILRKIEAADPCKGIHRASILMAYTGLRINEAIAAKWDEFNFVDQTWTVPRERMKIKEAQRGDFVIPLPPMLLATIQEWMRKDNNTSVNVCPAPRDSERHVTATSVEKHYREALGLEGKHSPHSWRSALSTIAREAKKDKDAIELQLDHGETDSSAEPYNRAKLLRRRRALLEWYEQVLIKARDEVRT